jgi:hypothetical protein
MINWILSLFGKKNKSRKPRAQIDITKPCWRCNKSFQDASAFMQHNCPHGFNCVMLGWSCSKCRIIADGKDD